MANKPSSIIIIGAGFTGMVSAIVMAKNGWQVTLIEQAPRPGLTIRGFTLNGVYFDSGIHFLGELAESGILRTYLNYLGLDGLEYIDFDREVFETFRFGDGSSIGLPVGHEAMLETLSAAFPAERPGLAAYLREVHEAYNASPFHAFSSDFRLAGELNPRWQVSLAEMLAQHISDNRLKAILSAPGLLYGVSPAEVSFLMHARVTGSHFDSVKTFAGGGKALAAACERRLAQLGVNLQCGSGVQKITMAADGALNGVELENGARFAADTVIYTGHPVILPDMLPENVFKATYNKRLRSLQDSSSAYALFYSVENCPAVLQRRNLLIYPQDEPFANAFLDERLPSGGPLYLLPCPEPQIPHKRRGADAGTGGPVTNISAFVLGSDRDFRAFYGTKRGQRPPEYQELKAERLAQMHAAIMQACPDLKDLKIEGGATPLTMHDWLCNPQGGLYGAAHNLSQYNPHPVTRVPNLYLAGQSVMVPGIMGVTISAFLTCGIILGHEALLKEVKACQKGA